MENKLNFKLVGEYRQVITNKGIFYYRLEKGSVYDRLFLYTREVKKNVWEKKWFHFFNKPKKTEKQEFEYNLIKKDNNSYGSHHWDVNKSGNRINDIKITIHKAISEIENFDPSWDGVMCDDKIMARDLILKSILEESKEEEINE